MLPNASQSLWTLMLKCSAFQKKWRHLEPRSKNKEQENPGAAVFIPACRLLVLDLQRTPAWLSLAHWFLPLAVAGFSGPVTFALDNFRILSSWLTWPITDDIQTGAARAEKRSSADLLGPTVTHLAGSFTRLSGDCNWAEGWATVDPSRVLLFSSGNTLYIMLFG